MINILALVASLNAHPMPPHVKWDAYLFDDRVSAQALVIWTEYCDNVFIPGIVQFIPPIRREAMK
jgi:hypothetical protein